MAARHIKFQRLLVLLVLLTISSSAAAASSVDIDNGDNNIWLNQGHDAVLNGDYTCNSPNSPKVKIDYSGNDYNPDQFTSSASGTFRKDMKVLVENVQGAGFGTYTVEVHCDGDTSTAATATNTFEVRKLLVTRKAPGSDKTVTVYQGGTFPIKLSAEDSVQGINLDSSNADYYASFLNGQSLDLSFQTSDNGDAVLTAKIPSDMEPGERTLVTSLTYLTSTESSGVAQESSNSGQVKVRIKKPWQFTSMNKTPTSGKISYSELSKDIDRMSVEATITHKGNSVNTLSSEDFYVKVTSNTGSLTRRGDWIESKRLSGDGRYRLSLKTQPALDLGSYNFDIMLDKEGGVSVTNFTVNRYITLKGKVTDAQGKPVNTQIISEKNGLRHQFNVFKGQYEGTLLPGNYNFSVMFPQAKASFKKVSLRKGVQGTIRYDDIPVNQLGKQVESVSVINAVGIIFGYPFEEASIEMRYDPSQVSFENVKVMECQQWSIERRTCFGEWSVLELDPGQIYPTVGKVVFEANPVNISKNRKKMLNAYMVVRNTELTSDYLRVGKDRVPIRSSMPVTGKIVTPGGDPVSNVNIKVSILDDGKVVRQVSTQTSSSGVFGVELTAPDKEGTYNVKVAASKKPYVGFSKKLGSTFDTYISKEIDIQVPDTVKFHPGKESQSRFQVINTGQASLKNVKISVSGLKNTWYSFNKNSWDQISPGGSREAVMTVSLPGDYCNKKCTEYPKFKVEAAGVSDGQRINTISTIQSVVTKKTESSTANQSTEEPAMSLGASKVVSATGNFFRTQSSLNIVLGLITVFMMTLAAAIKKKQKGSSSGRGRGSISSRGSSQSRVEKPNVKGEEQIEDKEEADAENEKEEGAEKDNNDSTGNKEGGDHKCDVCGEEFDTPSGLNLHKKAIH